jgi:hypothetical protein
MPGKRLATHTAPQPSAGLYRLAPAIARGRETGPESRKRPFSAARRAYLTAITMVS